jgi:hypothetical protein
MYRKKPQLVNPSKQGYNSHIVLYHSLHVRTLNEVDSPCSAARQARPELVLEGVTRGLREPSACNTMHLSSALTMHAVVKRTSSENMARWWMNHLMSSLHEQPAPNA